MAAGIPRIDEVAAARSGPIPADPCVATGFHPTAVPFRTGSRGRPGHRSIERPACAGGVRKPRVRFLDPDCRPDRAPRRALVNSASMVLLHDQGHEPDPRKEPHVSPPPRTPHHDQPPRSRCHALRIQPPSAPHPSAASSAHAFRPREVFVRGGQTGAHLRSGTDGSVVVTTLKQGLNWIPERNTVSKRSHRQNTPRERCVKPVTRLASDPLQYHTHVQQVARCMQVDR